MDTWGEIRFYWSLRNRIQKNMALEFLKNYKLSIPLISIYSTAFIALIFIFLMLGSSPLNEIIDSFNGRLQPYRSNLVFISVMMFLIGNYLSLVILAGSNANIGPMMQPLYAFIFPSHIRRWNIVRATYIRSLITLGAVFLIFTIIIYSISSPIAQWSWRPFALLILGFILTHIFANINLILSHLDIHLSERKSWQTFSYILGIIIGIIAVLPLIVFISPLLKGSPDFGPLIDLLSSPFYSMVLVLSNIATVIVIGNGPWYVNLVLWASLILVESGTTWIFWDFKFELHERPSLPTPIVAQSIIGDYGENREIPQRPAWWRKGPLRNIRTRLPHEGTGIGTLEALSRVYSYRNILTLLFKGTFFAIPILFLILFWPLNGHSGGFIFSFFWAMTTMCTGAMFMMDPQSLFSNTSLDHLKLLPFSGKEIVSSILRPHMRTFLISYYLFNGAVLIFTNSFDLVSIFMYAVIGPSGVLGVYSVILLSFFKGLGKTKKGPRRVEAAAFTLLTAMGMVFGYLFLMVFMIILDIMNHNLFLIALLTIGLGHLLLFFVCMPATGRAFDRADLPS